MSAITPRELWLVRQAMRRRRVRRIRRDRLRPSVLRNAVRERRTAP